MGNLNWCATRRKSLHYYRTIIDSIILQLIYTQFYSIVMLIKASLKKKKKKKKNKYYYLTKRSLLTHLAKKIVKSRRVIFTYYDISLSFSSMRLTAITSRKSH